MDCTGFTQFYMVFCTVLHYFTRFYMVLCIFSQCYALCQAQIDLYTQAHFTIIGSCLVSCNICPVFTPLPWMVSFPTVVDSTVQYSTVQYSKLSTVLCHHCQLVSWLGAKKSCKTFVWPPVLYSGNYTTNGCRQLALPSSNLQAV